MKSNQLAGQQSDFENIKSKWNTLADIDRARAVKTLHDRGVSDRTLAKELNCSPSKIRYLRTASEASSEDQILAQLGKISTRELVKSARKLKSDRLAKERNAQDQQITEKAQEGSKGICEWLKAEGFSSSQGESIISDARRLLFEEEQNERLKKVVLNLHNMPVSEVIQRMRPPRSVNDDVGSPGWHAQWLVNWVYFALKDTDVCHRALSMALDEQIKG